MPEIDPRELTQRTQLLDKYFDDTMRIGNWEAVADAVQLKCTLFARAGDPVYAIWRTR